MKDKIIFLIIGVLVGAIITTVCFLVYNKTKVDTPVNMDMNKMQKRMEEPPEFEGTFNFDSRNKSEKFEQDGQNHQEKSNKKREDMPDFQEGDNLEELPAKPEEQEAENAI